MRLKILLIVLCILVLPVTVFAQTSTTDYPTVGISVEYPESWFSTVIDYSNGVNILYMADSETTLNQIFDEPELPIQSGSVALLHYPPSVVNQFASDLDALKEIEIFPNAEWDEIMVNQRLAYKWSYEDERAQGFVVLYELSDDRFTFSVADAAVGELTDEVDAILMAIIASVKPYSITSAIERGLEFSETAISRNLSFSFQYPTDWYVSQVEELNGNGGLILSPTLSSTRFSDFWEQSVIIVSEVTREALGIDENLLLETDVISLDILESYSQAAARDGVVFSTAELIDINDVRVGRLASDYSLTVYLLVLNENALAEVWVNSSDSEVKDALESVARELITTISPDKSKTEISPELLEIITTASELDATYIMENGVAFDYPKIWSILEDNNLVLISNLESVEDFSAQSGEILLIISVEPTEYADTEDIETRLKEMYLVFSEMSDFDVNAFRFSEDEITDITFDIGEQGVDWDFFGGSIMNVERNLRGLIVVITHLEDFDEELAIEIFHPIRLSFHMVDEE